MPTIDVAMARSLRGGLWEMMKDNFVRSVAHTLNQRDIIGDTQQKVSDVKTAFSSWDNCMKANFCKWPVIAVIVVGSLILLAVVSCIVRCCCCGMSCCCSCFRCLKCCDCCKCCDPPGGRNNKYLDAPYIPPHHGGYQQQAPMHASYPAVSPHPPTHSGPPQYAEFETSRKGGEDALPQMPDWETSTSKKVLIEDKEEGMEMNNLNKHAAESNNPRVGPSAAGAVSPMSMDQRNAYSRTPQGGPNGYAMAAGAAGGAGAALHNQRTVSPFTPRDQQGPYGNRNQGYNQGHEYSANNLAAPSDHGSNRLSDGYGLDQPYDTPAAGMPLAAVGRPGPTPSPGSLPYGQGGGQPGTYGGFAEMPNEAGSYSHGAQGGYTEMPAHAMMAAGAGGQNYQSGYAEMPAEPNGRGGGQSGYMAAQQYGGQQNAAFAEMSSDQVAPVELDGGMSNYTPVVAAAAGAGAIGGAAAVVGANGHHNNNPRSPTRENAPDSYGMRRQNTGENAQNVNPFDNRGPGVTGGAVRPDGMRRRGTGDSASTGPTTPYGMDPRMRNSPGPMSPGSRNSPGPRRTPGPRGDQQQYAPSPLNSPAPQEGAYGRPAREAPNRTYSPAPQMRSPQHQVPLSQPTPRNPVQMEPPTSPIQNAGGFDFVSGYSRPSTTNYDRRPSESQERPSREGYPGFKPYKPAQQGWSGV